MKEDKKEEEHMYKEIIDSYSTMNKKLKDEIEFLNEEMTKLEM